MLETQIITFVFSIIFGTFFSIIIDLIHKYLFKINKIMQFIISFVFIICFSLIYFVLLLKLNNAIIHPYYILAFILGIFIEILFHKLIKRIVLIIKKWYNLLGG